MSPLKKAEGCAYGTGNAQRTIIAVLVSKLIRLLSVRGAVLRKLVNVLSARVASSTKNGGHYPPGDDIV